MPRTLFACAALALCAALAGAGPAAASSTATVQGAEAVNVRRGPGPNSPAFAMLRKGARVEVEAVAGGWALVVLEGGERGYLNATFLALPPDATVPALEAVTATPPPTETPSTPVETVTTPPLEEKLAEVMERVAALESARATPEPAHTLEQRADTPLPRSVEPLITPGDGSADLRDIAPSLALAGVGFLVGFLLGAAYGQRQERNRRTRVRF
jgi:hypothetical protein